MLSATSENLDFDALLHTRIHPHHGTERELKAKHIPTPLGDMMAVADDRALQLLEFVDCHDNTKKIRKICAWSQGQISEGSNPILQLLTEELSAYFQGKCHTFTTPIHCAGTEFQKAAWMALKKIPYGKTQSYQMQAKQIHHPTATRAVANANAANPLTIVIPCHRVIQSNGQLGGYAAGTHRKTWLIEHEAQHAQTIHTH